MCAEKQTFKMADVSLVSRQAKILNSSSEKHIVLKCKEIGGLILDLNLQHKYFQVTGAV